MDKGAGGLGVLDCSFGSLGLGVLDIWGEM